MGQGDPSGQDRKHIHKKGRPCDAPSKYHQAACEEGSAVEDVIF